MAGERIVSVAFLTHDDLERLGGNFRRHLPIVDDDIFADLILNLDKVSAEPFGEGVVLKPRPER